MKTWLEALDAILRGEATRLSQLKLGLEKLPVRGLTILIAMMGATYGICMGCFAIFNHENPQFLQIIASMIKVPALYLLTIMVTLPSLYVFNALVGSRLQFMIVIRLLVASLAVTLAVLASFGPIVAFFSLTTTSYPFMKLLNVAVFGLSGVLGLGFLLQTMHRLTLQSDWEDSGRPWAPPAKGKEGHPDSLIGSSDREKPPETVHLPAMPGPNPYWDPSPVKAESELTPPEDKAGQGTEQPSAQNQPPKADNPLVEESTQKPGEVHLPTPGSRPENPGKPLVPPFDWFHQEPKGALDFIPATSLSQNVRTVFACWVVLFGLVGAQMSWVLRPFIGAPDRDFTWLRPRESNFFDAVLRAIADLFR